MRRLSAVFLLLSLANLGAQTKIIGRVVDADSHAVAAATVRLWGLDAKPTDAQGYFRFEISTTTAKAHALAPGRDLHIEVEKEGLVVLEPPDKKFRLPDNPVTQAHFRVVMARRGSPLLARSERMLEYILRQKIQAAVEAKEQELARRDVLAEEAQRLSLNKETLLTAVAEYKDRLRTSTDSYQRWLALQDDADEAREYKVREEKSNEAEKYIREAITKAERAIREGEEEKKRLPEFYYGLGLNLFGKARYDSAAIFFAKADSAAPGDAGKLTMLGRALQELALYDRALAVFQRAFTIDTTAFGRASVLNNIASVLESKDDYEGALEKYNEALKILENRLGRAHPNVATVLSNIAGILQVKGDSAGRWEKLNQALKIDEDYFGRNHPAVAIRLNNIGGVLLENGDYDGALEKFNDALKINEAHLGRNHPNVATQLDNIACALLMKGDSADALEKLNDAMKITVECFGRNHPVVATQLNNIAGLLRLKGDYGGALENYNEALKIDEAYFGTNHSKVARELQNIASLLESKGKYGEALEKYNKELKIVQSLPESDSYVDDLSRKIAQILQFLPETEQWRYRTWSYLAQLSDTLRQRDRLTLFLQIGQGYFKQAKVDSALIYVEEALQLAQKNNDQEKVGTILSNVCSTIKSLQRWSEAERFLRQSAEHYRKTQGDSAVVLAYTYFLLACVAQAEGQTPLSREYAQKSLALAKRHNLTDLRAKVNVFLKQKR
jgi:tetratricopeptide (TPR) repeat protein